MHPVLSRLVSSRLPVLSCPGPMSRPRQLVVRPSDTPAQSPETQPRKDKSAELWGYSASRC